MLLITIMLKWQAPNGNMFLVIQKRVIVLVGPWSGNVVLGRPPIIQTVRKVQTISVRCSVVAFRFRVAFEKRTTPSKFAYLLVKAGSKGRRQGF